MPNAFNMPVDVSRTLFSVSPNSRRSIAQTLARQAAADLDLHVVGMNDVLQQRLQDPVAIGGGVAVVDCMIDHLDHPYTLVARLTHQVDFQAPDSQPIDLVCVTLSPSDNRIAHIREVGRLTRMMRDQDLCAKLRSASSADAMSALLINPVEETIAA
jgi:nitrogen PTS system EIIA component